MSSFDSWQAGAAFIRVFRTPTDDYWFGVTYKEDKPTVEAAFRKLIEDGEYRSDLYSDL